MEKVSITIEGFKNIDTAISFMNWFCHIGEQDIGVWLKCKNEENPNIATSIVTSSVDDNSLKMTVECN